MSNTIYGQIHEVFDDQKMISILRNNHVSYYYFSKPMHKILEPYLESGNFIFLNVSNKTKKIRQRMAYQIESVNKVLTPGRRSSNIFYDESEIRMGIRKIVNERGYKMYLDLEMSMPPYEEYQSFVSEVIQCGLVVADTNGLIVDTYSTYIKPTKYPKISARTKKFLSIDQDDIEDGISFTEFYNKYIELVEKYNPMILVWGKSDILSIKKCIEINNLNEYEFRYIDLLKLHRTYFNLKNDLGLFNAFKEYKGIEANQHHNALTDAYVTKEVFDSFKKVCNKELIVSFDKE